GHLRLLATGLRPSPFPPQPPLPRLPGPGSSPGPEQAAGARREGRGALVTAPGGRRWSERGFVERAGGRRLPRRQSRGDRAVCA
ncbi:Hypothetical predicted protein, partial [Marmota monax]